MNKQCSQRRTRPFLVVATLWALVVLAQSAHAGDTAPEWFRQLTHLQLPAYPEETSAVVLLDDETLTVKENGEMYINYRRVLKILRPSGKQYGSLAAYFDKDTKIDSFHAWSISPTGQEHAVKEKEAVETSPFNYALYADRRLKVMELPGVDVGSYVAFEYQQRHRPYAFSDNWHFQESMPVKIARFAINLPAGWEYQYHFGNWPEEKPVHSGGNTWSWEIDDIAGIEHETSMPSIESIAGKMAVSFFSPSFPQAARIDSWSDVATWEESLNASRRVATPKMQATIAQLTAGKTETMARIRALADYVQHQVRYVAIEIGIGGYQAHPAGDIFANSYGDCKDKASLLVTMLHEIGVEAYPVLVDSERGVVNPALPTPWTFNHMITAIRIPKDADMGALYATIDDPKLGPVLFFDPTSEMTPFGRLPGYEQDSYGLVVTRDGGEMVKMPILPPPLNRLLRVAHLQLTPAGGLSGEVEEIRNGAEAASLRRELLEANREERVKYFEKFLSEFLDRSRLTYASIDGLDKYDQSLVLHYKFEAADYAKPSGDLLLVRPRVLGSKASLIGDIAENKKRKYPVSYPSTSLQSDMIDIKLPTGYKVDELPPSANVTAPFAEYKSTIEAKDNTLYYNRSYTVKELTVPLDEMGQLRTFMRSIAADERNTAVLKKSQ